MSTRIVIEAEGDLPEAGKFAILAAAEVKFALWLEAFNKEHKTNIVGTVRPVTTPRKKAEKVAAPPAPDTLTSEVVAELDAGPASDPQTAAPPLTATTTATAADLRHRRGGLHVAPPSEAAD